MRQGGGGARPGLRERKKAKTRAQIQAHALRLFHAQGYAQTSIEQIADAAEVSPSTVFHYFPTKPELVLYDDLDGRLIAAIRAQPRGLSAVQALREGLTAGFAQLADDERALQLARAQLIRAVPELRVAMIDELARTLDEIAGLVAERTGRRAGDSEVVALAGSVVGVGIAAWLASDGEDWLPRFLAVVEAGTAALEHGFHLG